MDGEGSFDLFAKPSAKRRRAPPAKQQQNGGQPQGQQQQLEEQAHLPPFANAAPIAAEQQQSEAEARTAGEPSTTAAAAIVAPSSFKALGLTDWLCSVCRSLGMVRPTQVQQACIPEVLAGRDVIGLASTGSGKTAAFGGCLL
jgi:ATP-dependent RNA helicase DDX49/DBP8